jgi:hypothetical protein
MAVVADEMAGVDEEMSVVVEIACSCGPRDGSCGDEIADVNEEMAFVMRRQYVHCKKELAIFPSPAGMSLTKLSLGGKKLNYSRPGRV